MSSCLSRENSIDLYFPYVLSIIIFFFHNSFGWNTSIDSQVECILRGNIKLWKIWTCQIITYTAYPQQFPVFLFQHFPIRFQQLINIFQHFTKTVSSCFQSIALCLALTFIGFLICFIILSLVLNNFLTYFSLFPLVSIDCQTCFCIFPLVFSSWSTSFSIVFHPFFKSVSLLLPLTFVSFSSRFFGTISIGVLYSKMHFRGWIWPATLFGWFFVKQFFLRFLFLHVFSKNNFSRKWSSRMTNL